MMRLKPSLKNSARPALSLPPHQLVLIKKFIINWCGGLLLLLFLASGCSSSTKPTFLKEDVAGAIRDICKNEYKTDVRTRLLGQTLWIYLPVEDLVLKDDSDKPEKYAEKFNIERNQNELNQGRLRLQYLIYPVSEKEKPQEYKDNKDVSEKINNVWKVLRRVLFSMERLKEGEPQFFCLVIADIKNGFETQYTFYLADLKKVSYQFISWGEYQHRAIQETKASPGIIGDKEGEHLNYQEVTLEEFVVRQIEHRIKLKFQKPEVEKNADIDKEIQKIVAQTLKIYDFKEFDIAEFNNLFSGARRILSRQEILASPIK